MRSAPPAPLRVLAAPLPTSRSLAAPPVAFSITTPLAIVEPPPTTPACETNPAAPAAPALRVAARRSIVTLTLAPAALIVSVPPASQRQDQPVPTALARGSR